jgi:ABC-2 type transport system ATP-binding protein
MTTLVSTVSTRDLHKHFGARRAVDGVSLDLTTGVTGLLGPNGAGKTTLLRILATVAAPDSGDLTVLGEDPSSHTGRLAIRRGLGYLPQEPGLHRSFTCFQFVDYMAILKEWTARRERHDEVRRVLSVVGLTSVAHTRVGRLSGGMRRRLGIAQALIGAPKLLLLDEPTAGLDPEQRFRFRDLVGAAGDARTVLLSTHQIDDVTALCQQVVVMLDGQVRYAGLTDQLAARAQGHAWMADGRDPACTVAWRAPDGRWRHVGDPPAGAELVAATVEDGYMLVAAMAEPMGA